MNHGMILIRGVTIGAYFTPTCLCGWVDDTDSHSLREAVEVWRRHHIDSVAPTPTSEATA